MIYCSLSLRVLIFRKLRNSERPLYLNMHAHLPSPLSCFFGRLMRWLPVLSTLKRNMLLINPLDLGPMWLKVIRTKHCYFFFSNGLKHWQFMAKCTYAENLPKKIRVVKIKVRNKIKTTTKLGEVRLTATGFDAWLARAPTSPDQTPVLAEWKDQLLQINSLSESPDYKAQRNPGGPQLPAVSLSAEVSSPLMPFSLVSE